MITIFTIPKPFKDKHINIIQRNAIQSWCKLFPKCEIILFGDDYGVKEVADEFGLVYVRDIKKNEYGTPILNFVFEKAQEMAKNDLVCYVNADIIFTSDIISAIKSISFKNFLLVGRRTDVDIEIIDYNEQDWESKLRDYVKTNGVLHDTSGIDYFIFNKGLVKNMPDLTVGRRGWDNWFIYNMRKLNVPVIDITKSALIIHQNHNYNHIPQQKGCNWEGPESDYNIKLIGGKMSYLYCWTISDANWILVDTIERKNLTNILKIYRKIILITPKHLHVFIDIIFKIQQKIRHW